MDHFVIYVLCMSCFLVCSLQLCGHKGKGLTSWLLSLSHVVSDVVIDCIDS